MEKKKDSVMIGCVTPFMTPCPSLGLAVQDDDYLLQQAKISSSPSMNDKTVPNKCCPPSDSKSNLGIQTPDISELSHTGLLQCIRLHSDHSCDLDIWRRVSRPGSLMTQVLCRTLKGSSKWKSCKDLWLLPIYFPEVQGLQQNWSFLTQQKLELGAS